MWCSCCCCCRCRLYVGLHMLIATAMIIRLCVLRTVSQRKRCPTAFDRSVTIIVVELKAFPSSAIKNVFLSANHDPLFADSDERAVHNSSGSKVSRGDNDLRSAVESRLVRPHSVMCCLRAYVVYTGRDNCIVLFSIQIRPRQTQNPQAVLCREMYWQLQQPTGSLRSTSEASCQVLTHFTASGPAAVRQ